MNTRVLSELVNEGEAAWPWVTEQLAQSVVPVEILPCERKRGEEALLQIQVTTRSPMGAILYETAGILLDHGWLRFLGAGHHPKLQRSLPWWNKGRSNQFLLFADDVLGGQFAINGGGLNGPLGEVFYFAPDTLEWEATDLGYSQFFCWALTEGGLSEFYSASRWAGWESETKILSGDEAINVYPFMFTEGPPIGERSRCRVPVSELVELMGFLGTQDNGTVANT